MSRRTARPKRLITIGGYDYVVPHPRRLLIALVAVVGAVVAAFMFLGGSEDNVFAEPAGAPCYENCGTSAATAYPFPLARGSAADAAFRGQAQQVASAGAFYGSYADNRGVPARFHAYIPATSTTADPDYFEQDGVVYVPGTFLPANSAGEFDEITRTEGGSGRTVILGFQRDQVPDTQFLEVYGYLYWTSVRMNARATVNAPVVAVETWDPASPSAIRQPASRTYPEPGSAAARQPLLLVRRDDLRMSVDRVEFTPDQTRVHITIVNLGTAAPAAWDFSRATLLTGGEEVALRDFVIGSSDPQNSPPDDVLRSDNLPPGGQLDRSVVREGYLFFGPADAGKELTISLPDLNGSASLAGVGTGDFTRLVIPAPEGAATGSPVAP